jgi:hypothetical protein
VAADDQFVPVVLARAECSHYSQRYRQPRRSQWRAYGIIEKGAVLWTTQGDAKFNIPEAQFKAAEQTAKAENRTMSELFREALRRYEKERRNETITSTGGNPRSAA